MSDFRGLATIRDPSLKTDASWDLEGSGDSSSLADVDTIVRYAKEVGQRGAVPGPVSDREQL